MDNPSQHPIIIMKDVGWPELKCLVQYMYKGELALANQDFEALIRAAEGLRIRGLVGYGSKDEEEKGKKNRHSISNKLIFVLSPTRLRAAN